MKEWTIWAAHTHKGRHTANRFGTEAQIIAMVAELNRNEQGGWTYGYYR